MEGCVDASRRVRQEQNLSPHQLHQPHRKHHITDRITLVIMYSALHAHHRNILQIAEDEFPRMSGYGRYRKAIYLAVGQLALDADALRIISEPRPQHNGNLRYKIRLFPDTFVTL